MKENRFEQKDNIRWKRHTKRFISSRVRGSNEGEEVSVLQSGVGMSKKKFGHTQFQKVIS